MPAKPLSKLKHGNRIIDVLKTPLMFDEIRRATFLDNKTLQASLKRLVKHGYVEKNQRGQWNATEEATTETTTAEHSESACRVCGKAGCNACRCNAKRDSLPIVAGD